MKRFIFLLVIVVLAFLLRFYHLDQIPHGLYIDEVSIGHNAYTILQSGKDEYGNTLPLFFPAFGEYKLPVYIYLTSLSMVIFGKTEFAVRFMSAFFGTGTILLFYFFLKQLFSLDVKVFSKRIIHLTPLVGAFLLAITPWHIQFSRGGFEATVADFFFLLGIYLFLKWYKQPELVYLLFGILSLILTIYTYSSFRILTPLTLLAIFLMTANKHPARRKNILSGAVISLFLLLPILLFSFSEEGISRFSQTTAFGEYVNLTFLEKLFFIPISYLSNYFSFFSSSFLFATSDGIGRHTIKGIGPLFRIEFFLLLIGVFYTIKNKLTVFTKITLFLLFISPLAAALTLPSPHLLRVILLLIPLTTIISYGAVKLWEAKSKIRYITLFFLLTLAFEFTQYLHLYYIHYPMLTALDWGAEYKQLVLKATALETEYETIVIHSSIGDLGEYVRFYNDNLEYVTVNPGWTKPEEWKDKKILYITSPDQKKDKYILSVPKKRINVVYFPNKMHDKFAEFWEI